MLLLEEDGSRPLQNSRSRCVALECDTASAGLNAAGSGVGVIPIRLLASV
jgi:hypothetical protein